MSGLAAEPNATLASAARRAVSQALTFRLDEPGPLPDWLTPEARRAAFTYARGGRNRLQMVLATALFLAEKEQRPRVDLALVQRAAALQMPPRGPAVPPPAPLLPSEAPPARPQNGPLRWAASVLASLLLAVLAYPLMPRPHHAATVARAAVVEPILLGDRTLARPASPTFVAMKLATPGSLLLAAPDNILPQAAPAPASPPAAQATPQQPPKPPDTVILRFAASSPGAAEWARTLQRRLRSAGFAVSQLANREQDPGSPASLHFFHKEDSDAAARVQRVLDLGYTAPVFRPSAVSHGAPPPPGTIELYLP